MQYIDPNTELPQNLGEIYSNFNIRIVGQARINPANANQVDTKGIQILCSPSVGGAEGSTLIPDGTYILGGQGGSLWVPITRSGTLTATPQVYASGSQPKSRRDYVQLFYQLSSTSILCATTTLYTGTLYSQLNITAGQKIFDTIVGNAGDPYITHSDLQTAINDTPNNGWILIKKMCPVVSTITTNSNSLKLVFEGYGTGLSYNGAATAITLGAPGCQLVGLGQITGFTTGVNLNNQVNSRIEMAFSSNTTNINYGTLTVLQYSTGGSTGLLESLFGVVPVGAMLAVTPALDTTNAWQPPASGVIKDGFMRADGSVVPTGQGSLLQGKTLPNMANSYPRGSTATSWTTGLYTTGGSNTYTPTGTVPAAGLTFAGSMSTYSMTIPDHTHGFSLTAAGQSYSGASLVGNRANEAFIWMGAYASNVADSSHVADVPLNEFGHTQRLANMAANLIVDVSHTHGASSVSGSVGSGSSAPFLASGLNTPYGSITGSATLTGTTHNNEPQYVEVVWIIRVK